MKSTIRLVSFFITAWIIVFTACKKEFSCEDCLDANTPPVANAGPDQLTVLPKDSVLLDGSLSTDADGTISSYSWMKISGPGAAMIVNSIAPKTTVKALVMGVYKFQLTVTDNGGLSAKDTVQVVVDNPAVNQPPIANAGADQTITLPVNSVTLDGFASTDPENNIIAYAWTKISGPSAFTFVNPNAVQTQVTGLAVGIYQFELKVTDAGGLFSKDTMQVMVDDPSVNQPPVACAGSDRTVAPGNSVLLDGTCSVDPDNNINGYAWTKIAGPASYTFSNANASQTSVSNLSLGTYQFELKVTDAGGLSSRDTVQVNVSNSAPNYNPPVACAGNDKVITLPVNSVILDGSCSTDPDNNINGYLWTHISGPAQFTIGNTSSVQVMISDMVQGVYKFELKVTDAGGLFSKDTVQVTVNPANSTTCNISNRQQIPAQLTAVGSVSPTRQGMAVVTVGSKIFLAGGSTGGTNVSSRVDIYNASTNSWTSAELSSGRAYITPVVLGNLVFFGGGYDASGYGSTVVDIYNVNTNTWSTTQLSQGRWMMAGAGAGNKVLFAGGFNWGNYNPDPYPTIVDIYDVTTQTWTVQNLSDRPAEASVGIAATVHGDKIYLAGAGNDWIGWDFGDISSVINIYNTTTNSWSVSTLHTPRGFMAAIVVGDKTYWAGGKIGPQPPYEYLTNEVEIRDMNTGASSFACLFQLNGGFFTSFEAAAKNNKIVFFTGAGQQKNTFDIYDIPTDTWSMGVLPQNVENASLVSVNNTIYVAGATLNGTLSNQLWRLDF